MVTAIRSKSALFARTLISPSCICRLLTVVTTQSPLRTHTSQHRRRTAATAHRSCRRASAIERPVTEQPGNSGISAFHEPSGERSNTARNVRVAGSIIEGPLRKVRARLAGPVAGQAEHRQRRQAGLYQVVKPLATTDAALPAEG